MGVDQERGTIPFERSPLRAMVYTVYQYGKLLLTTRKYRDVIALVRPFIEAKQPYRVVAKFVPVPPARLRDS